MQKTRNWTQQETQVLRRDGKRKLPHELAVLLPGRTEIAIARKRKKLGIKLPASYFQKIGYYANTQVNRDNCYKIDPSLKWTDLDNVTIQLLLGSILGDGCIKKNSRSITKGKIYLPRNFTFYEGHGPKQIDYVNWKAKQLERFFAKPTKNKNRPFLLTASHPIFTELREKFYGKRKFKSFLPLDVLSQLDVLGLLIWYLDDGCWGVSLTKPFPTIANKRFSYRALCQVTKMLNEKLSLSLYVKKYRHRGDWQKKIVFDKENRLKIFPVWQNLFTQMGMPQCMAYKLR